MITVNSLQLLLVPVLIILAGRYYLEYVVDIENLKVYPTNQSLPEQLTGDWTPNNRLSSAQPIYSQKPPLLGVESAAEFEGKLYGSDNQLRLFELNLATNNIRFLGQSSGRVLGVRIDSKGQIYYLQSNKGIFRLDPNSEQPISEPIYIHEETPFYIINVINEPSDPRNVTFLDDFVIEEREDGNHLFYITQSSQRWRLDELTNLILENDMSGRVLIYDSATKKMSVLSENLHFPNGIEMFPDRSALIVNEFTQRRVRRIQLQGEKRGQLQTFLDKLPGEPDNVRLSLRNTFLIGFDGIRNSTHCHLIDRYPDSKFVRQAFLYIHRAMEVTLDLLQAITDTSDWQKRWADYVLESQIQYTTNGAVIEVDTEGRLLNVLQSSDGKVNLISEARELKSDQEGKRMLFLGAYFERPPLKLYF